MGVLQRFERRLEGLVGTAFARIFKGQVEPVEVAKALQREAEERRAVMGGGRILVPNRYLVELGHSDYERLAPWDAQLTNTFAEMVQEYLDDEGWGAYGDIEVHLTRADDLVTGVFRVASTVDPEVPPRRRPPNSLSLSGGPVGPAGEYGQQYGREYGQPGYGPSGHPTEYQQEYPPDYGPPGYGPPGYGPPGYPSDYPPEYPPDYPSDPRGDYGPPQGGYPPPYGGPPQGVRHTITVDGADRAYELRVGSNVVGRGGDVDLRLSDSGVSRRHADVRFDGQSALLHDLGSTNGTTVNGQQVQSWQLQHGDVIRLGHSTLVYRQDYP